MEKFVSRTGIVVTALWASLGLVAVAAREWITGGQAPLSSMALFLALWLAGTVVMVGLMYFRWIAFRFYKNLMDR